MSLENNLKKIFKREKEIENLLVNSNNLNPSQLVELSKELSDIKSITDLVNKKDAFVSEILDLSEILNDKNIDKELKEIATSEFISLKEHIVNLKKKFKLHYYLRTKMIRECDFRGSCRYRG